MSICEENEKRNQSIIDRRDEEQDSILEACIEQSKISINSVDIISNIPDDILFPSELNNHLKDEIKYLVQENTMLKKTVDDLEENLRLQMSEFTEYKLKEQQQTKEAFTANDVTRSKIIELSKKLREKSAELLHFKNKCAKLDQTLTALRQTEADRGEALKVEEKPEKVPESELKILHDKIAFLNSKLFDEKNQSLSLKNELKLAVKILQEEVGESFESIQQLSTNCHWRGRSQTIAELQCKMQEFKEKLKSFQGNGAKKSSVDEKISQLSKESEALKNERQLIMKKLEQSRQKIKSLEVDYNNLKNKYSNICAQYEKERALINNMAETHSNNQSNLTENVKHLERKIEKLRKDNKDLKLTLKAKECDIENLQKIIEEKNQIVANKISIRPNSPITTLSLPQSDANCVRLFELSKMYSERLQKEREEKSSFEAMYRNERHKAAKLEASLARAKLGESEKCSNKSYSSINSKPVIEDNMEYKLELAEEKIKALQTRLAIEKSEREKDMHEFGLIVQNYQG